MPRRALIALVVALVLAAPAAGDDLHGRKQEVDSRIARLHDHIEAVRVREDALRAQISDVTSQIRTLEAEVGDVSTELETLQQDLELHQRRLPPPNKAFHLRTRQVRVPP